MKWIEKFYMMRENKIVHSNGFEIFVRDGDEGMIEFFCKGII